MPRTRDSIPDPKQEFAHEAALLDYQRAYIDGFLAARNQVEEMCIFTYYGSSHLGILNKLDESLNRLVVKKWSK